MDTTTVRGGCPLSREEVDAVARSLAMAATRPPGIGVTHLLNRASTVVRWLPKAALPDFLLLLERCSSGLLAIQMQVMAEFAQLDRAGDPFDLLAHTPGGDASLGLEALDAATTDACERLAVAEIAACLNLAHRTARVRLEQAQTLTAAPELWQQLRDGALDRSRTTMVHEELAELTDEQKLQVAAGVGPVNGVSTADLRNRIRRQIIDIDPDAAQHREDKARRGRKVTLYPKPDAMAAFNAILPADIALRIHDFIDTCADRAGRPAEDDRTIDQRRADLFANIFTHLADDGAVTVDQLLGNSGSNKGTGSNDELAGRRTRTRRKQGRDVSIQVHLTLEALLGFGLDAGFLQGYGPISADCARAIAASAATLQVVLVDRDTGRTRQLGDRVKLSSVKSAGTKSGSVKAGGKRRATTGHDPGYRPGQHLRDDVTAIWPHCTFPRCRQPSWRTDLDHREAYDHQNPGLGGATTTDNLQPLCRAHHRLKTFTEWTCRLTPGGDLDWISPTGHRYLVQPEPAVVGNRDGTPARQPSPVPGSLSG